MVKEPKSMEEVIYFSNRSIDDKGKARVWVYRGKCPDCKGLMGKPKDSKTGKTKIRSTEYICPDCGHTEEKKEHEESLTADAIYTCPHCEHKGETSVPFIKKKIGRINPGTGKRQSIETLRLKCGKCDGNIDITKKMK